MTIAFDSSELRALAADLTKAGNVAAGKVRPIVVMGALNIKRQLQAEMGASTHFKGTSRAIGFDVTERASGITAEIGAKIGEGEHGGLAHVAYFGTSRGGGTVPDPQGALDAETPKFEAALLKILGDI